METAKLKDYMEENVIKEAHPYKKQISDFVQSNLFKTIVNMKALSNQASDIFRKAKHVLNPEKVNILLKRAYEDVCEGDAGLDEDGDEADGGRVLKYRAG